MRPSDNGNGSNEEWEDQEVGVEPLDNSSAPPPLPLRTSMYATQGSFDPSLNNAAGQGSLRAQSLPAPSNNYLEVSLNKFQSFSVMVLSD